MSSRWKGKLGGSHQTVIEAAWRFLPDVIADPAVTKISPGFIKAGKNATGRSSIKVTETKSCLLLSVRGASAHQEIRLFTTDPHRVCQVLKRVAEAKQFHIAFAAVD